MSEPAWPTGDEPAQQPSDGQERTGFWSLLWEDDDEPDPSARARPGASRPARPAATPPPDPGQTTQLRRPTRASPSPANQPTIPARPAAAPPPAGPGRTTVLPNARRPQPRDNSQDPT